MLSVDVKYICHLMAVLQNAEFNCCSVGDPLVNVTCHSLCTGVCM